MTDKPIQYPAFPTGDQRELEAIPGMSTREYIAARMLPAVYADFRHRHYADTGDKRDWIGWQDAAAIDAVRMADRLIAALDNIEPGQ